MSEPPAWTTTRLPPSVGLTRPEIRTVLPTVTLLDETRAFVFERTFTRRLPVCLSTGTAVASSSGSSELTGSARLARHQPDAFGLTRALNRPLLEVLARAWTLQFVPARRYVISTRSRVASGKRPTTRSFDP